MIIVGTGHSYERIHIEKWLEKNDTCPKTNMHLEGKLLVANWNLKQSIEEWRLKSGHPRRLTSTMRNDVNMYVDI